MNPFKTLGEKPWLAQPAGIEHSARDGLATAQSAARIALRFILAIVTVIFFLFILTFLSRSQYPDFQALAGQPWQPFTDPSRLWFNTGLLALSSLAIQFGVYAARREQLNNAIAGISSAVFFALMFLLAQLSLWQHLQSLGFYINTNPANSYFYLLTAIHGLHLLGGLLVLTNVVFRVWYDGALDRLSGPLQLCATYWHYLLGIWLVLFALLTSRPETINALAAMCGF
ncbi:MAG: cytochrome c oxidase subunit 3 [Proteobacteria bacterium]|nr:cytochrome c oxidase subunit 3 [Pseudomonadota bacterium]